MFYDSPVEARLSVIVASSDYYYGTTTGSFLVKSFEPVDPPSPLSCTHIVSNDWGAGFQATITITNTSDELISGWLVNWDYADGVSMSHGWNANFSGSGPYSASSLSWNQNIAPGGNKSFGLVGSKVYGQELGDVPIDCQ